MSNRERVVTRRRIVALLSTGGILAAPILVTQGQDDINHLPANLPVPVDDGACDHLAGMTIPPIPLPGTKGHIVVLANVPSPRTWLYVYLRTGVPGSGVPRGWDEIPGARGCTPQSCSMRDHYKAMKALGAEVFGLSSQTTEYQSEMVKRLHLPFEVLSDSKLVFAKSLRLPTFIFGGVTLIKRLTLVIKERKVEKVFYPVFPPDQHGAQVVAWLKSKQSA